MKFINLEEEAARADRILAKPDPERIWLGPRCEEVGGDRAWCSAPQDCEDCDMKSVEYIRADLEKSKAVMTEDWLPIDTSPRDGTVVECLWPGFGQPAGRLHQGYCVYKRDWYAFGNKYLELWWTGDEFQNPTAQDPTHWRRQMGVDA